MKRRFVSCQTAALRRAGYDPKRTRVSETIYREVKLGLFPLCWRAAYSSRSRKEMIAMAGMALFAS